MVPASLVTGPIGVGKTAVLREADAILVEAGSEHATIEPEEIARCHQNLAALWSKFVAVGASRLLLAALPEQRPDLRFVSQAIPGATITVVRLDAPVSVLERRIRMREPASPDELAGARSWETHLDQVKLEDHVVGRRAGPWPPSLARCFGWPARLFRTVEERRGGARRSLRFELCDR